MTNAILESINTKDKLYKILVQANIQNEILYNNLKLEFKTYKTTLRKCIREAKRLYYLRMFDIAKHDIKKKISTKKFQ